MTRQMTSRQRVLASLNHREPDHVPCWLGASPEWKALACAFLGLPDDESLLAHLGDDFRRVHSSYAGPQAAHPTAHLSHPDATYRTPFGIERHGYGYGMPLDEPLKGATTAAEVHAYPWPDPEWMDVSHIRGTRSNTTAVRDPGRRMVALLARCHRPAGLRRADLPDGRQPGDRRRGDAAHGGLLPGGQPAHLRDER